MLWFSNIELTTGLENQIFLDFLKNLNLLEHVNSFYNLKALLDIGDFWLLCAVFEIKKNILQIL